MPMAKRLIAASLTENLSIYRQALDEILYYLKRNWTSYRSHRKRAIRSLAINLL